MPTFVVTGRVDVVSGYASVHVGDTWTLTVVTDGFTGLCTVANGHLISVTPSLIIGSYVLANTNLFPASPVFDPAMNTLTGDSFGLTSITGFITGDFIYGPTSWSADDESAFASGSVSKKCLQ